MKGLDGRDWGGKIPGGKPRGRNRWEKSEGLKDLAPAKYLLSLEVSSPVVKSKYGRECRGIKKMKYMAKFLDKSGENWLPHKYEEYTDINEEWKEL